MALPLRPASRLGWWVFGLGIGTAVWGVFATVISRLVRSMIPEGTPSPVLIPVGLMTVVVAVVLAVTSIVLGLRALRRGERSVLMLLGLVPAVVVGGFWIIFAVGEVLVPH